MIQAALEPAMRAPGSEILMPIPLDAGSGGWRRWIAPVLSTAVLVAALLRLRRLDFHALPHLPTTPFFWLVFVAGYLVLPASEMLIYRRLWRLPLAGFAALLAKRISNEVLLGYSGEVYFYGWARRHAKIAAAPFGAIKDVSMLSAAVGNAFTLLLLILTWPLLRALNLGLDGEMLAAPGAVIALLSLATLWFRRTLFSLPRRELRFIALVHAARVSASLILTALLWCIALPAAPLVWWLLLSTMRLLISRLPFVANKDILFAGVVAFAIGREGDIAALIAMLAALTLAVNVALGAVLALAELVFPEGRECA